MGSKEAPTAYPASTEDMTAALTAALEAGDPVSSTGQALDRIMGTLGQMTRARRMKRVAQETVLGRESLYKSMLRRKDIRVVSITEPADDSPTGKLMEAIIDSVDEFYSENLPWKTRVVPVVAPISGAFDSP